MTSPRVVTYCSFAVLEYGLKLNPGGQLLAISCKETDADVPPEVFEAMWENRNKLLTSQEARTLFDAASLKELDAELN